MAGDRLLTFDASMRERGLLLTLARYGAEVDAASAAADYLDLPALAAAIRSSPLWTIITVDDLEAGYRDAATPDAIRVAFARRFASRREDFLAPPAG